MTLTLATLTTGCWRPYRLHTRETAAERARHSTDAVSVRVKLTDAPSLRALLAHQEATARRHRELTLPSPVSDMRMVIPARQLEHAEMLRRAGDVHKSRVDSWLADYPAIRAAAPHKLNGLYESEAWPDVGVVASACRMTWRYLPMPSGGAWDTWREECIALGRQELGARLTEALRHYIERLKSADRLHDSTLGALRDMVADVLASPDMSDPDSTRAASVLADLLPPDLVALRGQAAEQARQDSAQAIADVMAGLGVAL